MIVYGVFEDFGPEGSDLLGLFEELEDAKALFVSLVKGVENLYIAKMPLNTNLWETGVVEFVSMIHGQDY